MMSLLRSGVSVAIASAAEFVYERRSGRIPPELGAGSGGAGPLVEQQDFGEIVTHACPSLLLGAGDRASGAGCDGGGFGYFGSGRNRSIADHEVTARRFTLQGSPKEVSQVGDVHRRPVLLSGPDHN